MNVYETEAFALLQQGMKDKQAYEIVMALALTQARTGLSVLDNFERFAKDQTNDQ